MAQWICSAREPLLKGLQLTAAQHEMAQRVHAAVTADFTLRRRMLLRRCDVTVQSFLRGRGKTAAQGVGSKGRGPGDGVGVAPVDLPPLLQV